MQINSTHWTQFKKMGLDVVNNPIDNLQAGIYLISKNGTKDYSSSKSCWQPKIDSYTVYDVHGTSTLPDYLAMQ